MRTILVVIVSSSVFSGEMVELSVNKDGDVEVSIR